MSIQFYNVLEIVKYLDKPKIIESQRHIEARCPLCGDSKTKSSVTRLHIDYYGKYDTYIYKCHRCGESGDIFSLYSHLSGISYHDAKLLLDNKVYDTKLLKKRLIKSPINHINHIEEKKILDINIDTDCIGINSIPKDSSEKMAHQILIDFKKNRMIPDSLPIWIAIKGRYKSRIIIPIIIDNNIEYFQARTPFDDVLPKYLNPKVEKSSVIMNSDNFNPDKYIIVTEGIIDAYMIHKQGTCVIGGYLDLSYIDKLMNYTNKGLIIALDNPKVDDNSYKVLKKLINKSINRYKEKLYFFVPSKEYNIKDLNDLVIKYKIDNVYDFITKYKIDIMRMKLLLISI